MIVLLLVIFFHIFSSFFLEIISKGKSKKCDIHLLSNMMGRDIKGTNFLGLNKCADELAFTCLAHT